MSAIGMRPKYDSAKFEKPGDSVKGTIVEFEDVQMTVYNSNPATPRYWDDAKTRPMMQTRVLLERVEGDESSRINLWVKPGDQTRAVRDAIIASGSVVKDIEIGGDIGMEMTGTDPDSKNPANPKKLYAATYEAPFDPTA